MWAFQGLTSYSAVSRIGARETALAALQLGYPETTFAELVFRLAKKRGNLR